MKKIDYVPEPHRVLLGEPVRAEKAQTKWYTLWPAYDTLPEQTVQAEAREIAINKIDHFIPQPHAGLGVTIFSPNFLNIIFWDYDEPTILHPHLYELTRQGLRQTIRQQDIAKVGPFCLHEIALLQQERPYWEQFLTSPQKEEDKGHYLTHGFKGNLE